jgi:hypothetical protein
MFARTLVDGAQLYEDATEQSALIAFRFWGFNLWAFDDFLEEPGWDASSLAKTHLAELLKYRAAAIAAMKAGDQLQTKAILTLLKGDMDRVRERERLLPLARKGDKFKPGRQAGKVSPLRKAVRAYLKSFPDTTAEAVWAALKERPPRSMSFCESPRLGRYVETEGQKDTGWGRFQNIVSEEKRALKG